VVPPILDVPENVSVNVPVNQRQQLILIGISKSGSIQIKTIRNRFRDVSERTLKRDIEHLKRLELIIFMGPPKTGKYVLTKKGKGKITNKEYRDLTNLSDEGARLDLKDLVSKGLVKPKGKGRNSHYVLTKFGN
jgi:predicted HTH transcriptional regulator